jgi:hypothetical protein
MGEVKIREGCRVLKGRERRERRERIGENL